MKIGFTGTQTGMTEQQKHLIKDFIQRNKKRIDEVHHGDCIGADKDFHKIARHELIPTVIHPPVNNSKRAFCQGSVRDPKPYLERNQDIINECALLIATPKDFQRPDSLKGQGTWYTVTHTEKRGKKVLIVYPDGTTEQLN
jgi:hypothetical protein